MTEQPTAETVLQTIRSRGHWEVGLHPVAFDEKRIASLGDLDAALQRARVRLRGSQYPYDAKETTWHKDFIQGTVSSGIHHEVWRLYQSAQFVHVFAMVEDWVAEYTRQYKDVVPGEVLEITSTLWTMTEIFLFCARLAEALRLTGDLVLSYRVVGLEGRELTTFDINKLHWFGGRKAAPDLHEYPDKVTLPSATLITSAAELAVSHAINLYERFHWQPDRASLVEEQRKLLERRFY